MSRKTSERGAATKRAGAQRRREFRGVRTAAALRQSERETLLWKGVAAKMKLRDLDLHLQGLYAELGKALYERDGRKPGAASKRSRELKDLFDKIAEMRASRSRIEKAGRLPARIV